MVDVTIHPLSMAGEIHLGPPLAGDNLPMKKGAKRGAEVCSRTKTPRQPKSSKKEDEEHGTGVLLFPWSKCPRLKAEDAFLLGGVSAILMLNEAWGREREKE